MAVTTHVWHLWPGRHWPALPEEEQQFVAELRLLAETAALAGRSTEGHERMHYTAVLNALRCGVPAPALAALVPGMHPADLLAAYEHLDALRIASATAWHAIVADPSVATLADNSEVASILLPVPLSRLATVASNVHGDGALRAAVDVVVLEVAAHVRAAEAVEHMLVNRTPPDAGGVKLGVKLHHPQEPALWGAPYFLPDRVTSLSPMRVADLLGERPRPVGTTR